MHRLFSTESQVAASAPRAASQRGKRALPGLPKSLATGLVGVLTLQAAVARACPDCAVGRAARRRVWLDDFALNLAVALLPFLVVAAVSLWADRIGRSAPDRTDKRGTP